MSDKGKAAWEKAAACEAHARATEDGKLQGMFRKLRDSWIRIGKRCPAIGAYGGEREALGRRKARGPLMSKSTDYIANAEECQRMAEISKQPHEKQLWLEMAESWLRMIPSPNRTASEKFDTAEHEQGTNQVRSEAEH
jgi:hypothetical protein